MTALGIILVVISAWLHAAWNALGKRQESPTLVYFTWSTALGLLIISPLLFYFWATVSTTPLSILPYLLISGVCQTFYMAGLAGIYRHGNLSIHYPLARALPVMILPLATYYTEYAQPLSKVQMLAMVLIALAAIGLTISQSHESIKYAKRHLSAGVYAIVACLATVGYSLSDDFNLRHWSNNAGSSFPVIPVVYLWLQGLSTLLCCSLVLLLRHWLGMRKSELVKASITVNVKHAAITGLSMYLTYGLVLIAMTMSTNVSMVVALRQLSIPFGVILGVYWLKERVTFWQLLYLSALCLGVLVILL